MSKKQLLALFLCSLVPWTIGNGIAPLLPVQAAGLGATQALAGYLLSLSHLAMAAGTVTAGWLSDRFRRHKIPAIVAGLASTPALWLMGQATTLWGLAVALAAWFFCAGLIMALISIAAGLCAEGRQRGKVFGLLALTAELGALFGGGLAGPMAERWGYASMYAVLSLIGILGPLAGLLWEERGGAKAPSPETAPAREGRGLGKGFHLLFVASLGAAIASFVFFLGRSFVMADLGFDAAALSTAGAIGGAIALPVPLLAGWLSDRLGRKRFVAFSFLATTAALLVLCASTDLWHFWVASVLFTLSFVGGPAGSALVTDLVPREALGRGLAVYNATTWLGGIAGCALTGYAAQGLGTTPTLIAGAFLPLLAVGLLAAAGRAGQVQRSAAAPSRKAPSAEPLPATA
jgi:MFS family permease